MVPLKLHAKFILPGAPEMRIWSSIVVECTTNWSADRSSPVRRNRVPVMSHHCTRKGVCQAYPCVVSRCLSRKVEGSFTVRRRGRTVSLGSRSWLSLAVLTVVGLTGCQTTTQSPWGADRPQMALAGSVRMADQSLYVRLGEKPAIVSIVDDFVTRVVSTCGSKAGLPKPISRI